MAAAVPVVGFWSTERSISTQELRAALSGMSSAHVRVVVDDVVAAPVARALGVDGHAFETGSVGDVRRAVAAGALGLLRLDEVTPEVRALALDGVTAFGSHRVATLDEWPLLVTAADGAGPGWDQQATWTLAAGGDMQLDRRMANQVTVVGRGVDFPFDGGTVQITGRTCCSFRGYRVPEWERTGNEGAVRALFTDADLAIANLEAAAVDDARLHRLGENFHLSLNFSGDPTLLTGIDNAGFDFLSLANNHIHNGGPAGISDTREALDDLGIAHAGAGPNLRQASRPAVLDVGAASVAIVPCATIGSMAGPSRPGARSCYDPALPAQIAALAGEADVVVVFPHWGLEYRTEPNVGQRRLAAAWVDAGADVVIGAHSHWAGAIEEIGDALVFYSLGNLTFDQPWSEATMLGVILELTFHGDELVQAWVHPTLIVEDVQPNLLEPDSGAERVLRRMKRGSSGLLDW